MLQSLIRTNRENKEIETNNHLTVSGFGVDHKALDRHLFDSRNVFTVDFARIDGPKMVPHSNCTLFLLNCFAFSQFS